MQGSSVGSFYTPCGVTLFRTNTRAKLMRLLNGFYAPCGVTLFRTWLNRLHDRFSKFLYALRRDAVSDITNESMGTTETDFVSIRLAA